MASASSVRVGFDPARRPEDRDQRPISVKSAIHDWMASRWANQERGVTAPAYRACALAPCPFPSESAFNPSDRRLKKFGLEWFRQNDAAVIGFIPGYMLNETVTETGIPTAQVRGSLGSIERQMPCATAGCLLLNHLDQTKSKAPALQGGKHGELTE